MDSQSSRCSHCGSNLSGDGICVACALIGPFPDDSAGSAQTFAGYQLLDEIGQDGAMGSVYRARDSASGREVALKMLRVERMRSEELLRRFRLEIETSANLDHPHLLPIYDVGEHHGQLYYTMRLASGGSLARQLADRRWEIPRSDRKAAMESQRAIARLLHAVARAVHHAHERGVLHRDLKPGNLLLDKDGTVYVSDFGLAKQLGSEVELTRTQGVLGTPAYMAPEQAEPGGRNVTARTDVWSLGVILYEMLAGRVPFEGDGPLQVLDAARTREPRSPASLHPLLDRDLVLICLKCLEKDPGRRYATAAELAADLERFIASQPISARASTHWETLVKWWARNPVVAPLVSGLAATLILGVTATTWQAIAASRARDRALALLEQNVRVNETIFDIFSELDVTRVKSGKEPLEALLAQKLVKAGKALDSLAISDPLTLARLKARVAETLLRLGFASDALEGFQTSLAILRQQLGKDHPDTLAAVANLAVAHHAMGRFDLALPLMKEVFELLRLKKGAADPDTITCMNNLAMAYLSESKPESALDLLAEGLRLVEAKFGANHASTALIMDNLGLAFSAVEKPEQALILHSNAYRIRRDILGPANAHTIMSLNNLGTAYLSVGQTNRSLEVVEGAVLELKSTLGADHPDTLRGMHNLAYLCSRVGQLARAIELWEETVEKMKVKLGVSDPDTVTAVENLEEAYGTSGRRPPGRPAPRDVEPARPDSGANPSDPPPPGPRTEPGEGDKADPRSAGAVPGHIDAPSGQQRALPARSDPTGRAV